MSEVVLPPLPEGIVPLTEKPLNVLDRRIVEAQATFDSSGLPQLIAKVMAPEMFPADPTAHTAKLSALARHVSGELIEPKGDVDPGQIAAGVGIRLLSGLAEGFEALIREFAEEKDWEELRRERFQRESTLSEHGFVSHPYRSIPFDKDVARRAEAMYEWKNRIRVRLEPA